jgi:hypothetical protein
VEGRPVIIDFVPTNEERFKTATIRVTVTDGRLTVDADGGRNTKVNHITILPSKSLQQQTTTPLRSSDITLSEEQNTNSFVAQSVIAPREEAGNAVFGIRQLYPNPSTSSFNVTIQGSSNQAVRLHIYDFSGRLVETRTGIALNTVFQVGQNLPRGMYLLQVIQGNKKAEMKITKM